MATPPPTQPLLPPEFPQTGGNTPPMLATTQAPNMSTNTPPVQAPSFADPLPTTPRPAQPYAAPSLPAAGALPSFTPGAQQSGNGYQAGSITAPQVSAPRAPGYNAQGAAAPQINAPAFGGYAAQSVAAPGVSAAQASAGKDYSQWADAITQQGRRVLDPRFEQEEAAFRQRMVNQGLQEGTEAFNTAYANWSRNKNDAYTSLANQAFLASQGAQAQDFGQSLSNAQLRMQADMANAGNALQAAGLSQADRQFGAGLGRDFAQMGLQAQSQNAANFLQAAGLSQADRQFGANMGLQYDQLGTQVGLANAGNFLQAAGLNQADRQFAQQAGSREWELANAFNMQRAQLGENQRQFDAGFGQNNAQFGAQFGEGQRQFDATFGRQQGRDDMADLMALLGYGTQGTAQNNATLSDDQRRAMAMFGLIPGMSPTPLDVNGTAGQAQQNNMASWQQQNANRNAQYAAWAQVASAFLGG